MDERHVVKEEVNTSDTETNPNNIKQEVPFEFVGIKTEVQDETECSSADDCVQSLQTEVNNEVDVLVPEVCLQEGPKTKTPTTNKCPTCHICGKVFRCVAEVKRHLPIHTGDKPHKCETCVSQMNDEKLIECVRKYPAIYDMSHSKYLDNNYKSSLWKKISEEVKEEDVSCKRRINIRDQFKKSLNRRKTKSGQVAESNIKRYKYKEVLQFLMPHIHERSTISR